MSIEHELIHQKYKRVDEDHILDIYVPDTNAIKSIVFILRIKPDGLFPTKEIDVSVSHRESDGRWLVGFFLLDEEFTSYFELFCQDLIESSRQLVFNEEDGATFLVNRFESWATFFSRRNQKLSKNAIRGLVGELIFIKHYLIPEIGKVRSINSWMGPTNSKQDFLTSEKWFEVKTIKPGGKTIHITSLEQLSRLDYGELAVICLNDVSRESSSGLTLNQIYNELLSVFEDFITKKKFETMMILAGYQEDPFYDNYSFEFVSYSMYGVVEGFPRILTDDIHEAISDLRYEIQISHLNKYKK